MEKYCDREKKINLEILASICAVLAHEYLHGFYSCFMLSILCLYLVNLSIPASKIGALQMGLKT
jgi:hypothetical protein